MSARTVKTSRSRRGKASRSCGRLLEALVLLEPTDQLGARIARPHPPPRCMRGSSMRDLISASIAAITRYSAASSSRSSRHQLDIFHVLGGDLGDRDIQDIQILPLDQIEQQVERTLEGIEKDLQRIRRDVEIQQAASGTARPAPWRRAVPAERPRSGRPAPVRLSPTTAGEQTRCASAERARPSPRPSRCRFPRAPFRRSAIRSSANPVPVLRPVDLRPSPATWHAGPLRGSRGRHRAPCSQPSLMTLRTSSG